MTPEGVETVSEPGEGDEDLFLPVGLLWLSHIHL